MADPKKSCVWRLVDDEWNLYAGECGVLWELFFDTPEANEMQYCPHCGYPIECRDGEAEAKGT